MMAPAFSSTRQAAAFAVMVLAVLLSPMLIGKALIRPRDQIYSSLPWGTGPYPYLHNQIFEEKGDIDVVFMGPSTMWYAIDTPYFQKKLSEKLGRPAAARTLCWDWVGADAFYRIAKDLLEHRNVHMIVFCDPAIAAPDTAHKMAPDLFQWPDHAQDLAGLEFRAKTAFYAAAIIGMPKNLLGRLRPNLPAIDSDEVSWPGFYHMENPFRRLGSLACPLIEGRDFVKFTPASSPDPTNVYVYSEATSAEFQFPQAPMQPMQAAFIRKVADLAREHHVQMVYLYVPRSTEMRAATVNPNAYWPDFFPDGLTMMGIPPAKLFAGLSDDDTLKLYWEYRHLNINGQEYFTPVVTPALVQVYEDKIGR
ncbi:MAG TPA: hypothetical protein VKV04_18420 [Verrucomicrobiae bacterium]|nr:hypothetical protein [Verrucomicrobiae bacterium]